MLVDTHLLKRDGYIQGWRHPADPTPLAMGHCADPKCPVVIADVHSCLTSPQVGIFLKVRSQPCCSSGLVLCVFYL